MNFQKPIFFPREKFLQGEKDYLTEVYSKSCQTSKMERNVAEVDLGLMQHLCWNFQPLTIITKRSTLDVAAGQDPPLCRASLFQN